MEKSKMRPPTPFTELAEFPKVGVCKVQLRGYIIKANSVVLGKDKKVGIADSSPEQPSLIIHKSGDVIESAEFVCKCGRSATLQFDYDDQ
jgi:hypothetical protein